MWPLTVRVSCQRGRGEGLRCGGVGCWCLPSRTRKPMSSQSARLIVSICLFSLEGAMRYIPIVLTGGGGKVGGMFARSTPHKCASGSMIQDTCNLNQVEKICSTRLRWCRASPPDPAASALESFSQPRADLAASLLPLQGTQVSPALRQPMQTEGGSACRSPV